MSHMAKLGYWCGLSDLLGGGACSLYTIIKACNAAKLKTLNLLV